MGTTTLCEACQKNEMNVVESSDEPETALSIMPSMQRKITQLFITAY
ncbi:hypothetical protein [Bacillus safensis]